MALFSKTTPETKVGRDLETAVAKRADLDKRLQTAKAKAIEAKVQAEALAADGADDAKLTAIETEMRAYADRAATLIAALATITGDIATLEAEISAIRDRETRVATAAAIEQIAADLQQSGARYAAAAIDLATKARRASDITIDAGPLASYATNAATEVPPAVSMISEVLRHHAVMVADGSAKAALPMPEQPAPKPQSVAPPPVERVFALKHLRFTDANGNVMRVPKMHPVDLSPAHAAIALKRAWAVPLNDSRVRGLNGAYGAQIPPDHWCENLDDPDGAKPAAETVATPSRAFGHGQFEPHPRIGKPYTVVVPTTPAEPLATAGTRSLPQQPDGDT
jgi:hypothetical protein